MGEIERAWLPPYVVLVINDNLYGLMCALSYICSVGPYGMLELHMLESRLKEEDYMLIKAKCKLINIQDKVLVRMECLNSICWSRS